MSDKFSAQEARRKQRSERREAEMARGHNQIKINLARELIIEVQKSVDAEFKFRFALLHTSHNAKEWAVSVDFRNGQHHVENWWEFPTEELKAKILLFGGRFTNVYPRGES